MYRRKIVIEAFQMTLKHRFRSWPQWLEDMWKKKEGIWPSPDFPDRELFLHRSGGILRIHWDDWIIKGTKGLNLCKPDIFEARYEEA